MRRLSSAVLFAIFAGIGAIFALPSLIARNATSTASLALGTDDAFSLSGLEPRENQVGGGALRWLRPQASFAFAGVGPGPVDIRLEVRDHRGEVTLLANGATIGQLARGERHFSERIVLSGESLVFGIEAEGFQASTRTLGTQFVSLSVTPAAAHAGFASVPRRMWFVLAGLALVSALVPALSGLSALVALPPFFTFLLLILPGGLWRSHWLMQCALLMAAATIVSALVAKGARGGMGIRSALQVCVLAAVTIHGVIPPSPLLNQGDAQLHGNKLAEVAKGNLFPTSRTDHNPPFEIPYGFSFYGLLSPWSTQGTANVEVVRRGAAFFSALSVVVLAAWLGRTSSGVASAAVLLWTFAPVNLRTMGFGNLSNVFAQAIFLLFLVAAARFPKGKPRGVLLALLVAVSAVAHLSSFIVFFVLLLASFLFAADRRGPAFKSLLAGVAVSVGYFASFLPLILAQVQRLLAERGGSSGVFDPWRLPNQILSGLGLPFVLLLLLSILTSIVGFALPLGRSLAAAGLVLAATALVSPVEVRYLLALVPLLVSLAALAFAEDDDKEVRSAGQKLTAIVDLPGLRALSSELVRRPLAAVLLGTVVVHGLNVLKDFMPIFGT